MQILPKQIKGFYNLTTSLSQSREELYYTDNSGGIVQLTYSGSIGGQNLTPASGSEVKTGYTFDGYPVYRQFFSGSSISSGQVLETGVRDIIYAQGWIKSTGDIKYMVPTLGASSYYRMWFKVLVNNDMVVLLGGYITGTEYRFLVEYTKI